MPSQKNIDDLKTIDQKLTQAKSIILTDYAGLNVADQSELRKQIKQAGGEFTVHKNTLLKLVLSNRAKELPQSTFEALKGPTAIIYGYEDAVATTKVVVEFAKANDNLKIKVGVLEGVDDAPHSALTVEQLENLAKLPTKSELIAQLIARLNSPRTGFVNVLAGNLRGLVNVLDAHKEKLAASS